ncbi:MAG: O-methyltransferase [Candidatus Dormibacteria bacterium]
MQPKAEGHLETLIERNPAFHDPWLDREDEGPHQLTSWRSTPGVLRWIAADLVAPGAHTLEIGCGASTIVFALAGAAHTVVTLGPGEMDRVRAYCEQEAIDLSRVTHRAGPSPEVLPHLAPPPGGWDLVYIDGGHAFPLPMVDWYFTHDRLRIGGVVLVDDVQIRSVRVLHDFLEAEPNWELVGQVDNTSAFRRLGPEPPGDWMGQAYNLAPQTEAAPSLSRFARVRLRRLTRRD